MDQKGEEEKKKQRGKKNSSISNIPIYIKIIIILQYYITYKNSLLKIEKKYIYIL